MSKFDDIMIREEQKEVARNLRMDQLSVMANTPNLNPYKISKPSEPSCARSVNGVLPLSTTMGWA